MVGRYAFVPYLYHYFAFVSSFNPIDFLLNIKASQLSLNGALGSVPFEQHIFYLGNTNRELHTLILFKTRNTTGTAEDPIPSQL